MKQLANILTALCFMFPLGTAAVADTLIVGLDISSSNPLVSDDAFARQIGAMAAERIEEMQPGDHVVIETFGLHGIAVGQRAEFPISRRHRPEQVAHFVSQLISAMPQMAREGRLVPHPATNILSFLELRTEREGCESTALFIATDGFEASDAVSGDGTLPTPHGTYLSGCSVTLIGVGGGTQQSIAARELRDQWISYLTEAGADPVVVNRG